MHFSTSAVIFLAALVSQVSATIFVTEPIATTQCSATLPCPVKWNDDGNAPSLALIGPAKIELAVGSQFRQYPLQLISASTDVSKLAQVDFRPDPAVGQTGAFYFVKFTSLAFMDPAAPQFPYTQYSAKFTIGGMMGQWNQTMWADINGTGANTAVPSSAAPVSTPPASVSRIATTTAARTTSSASGTARASAIAESAAMPMAMPGVFTSFAVVTVATMVLSLGIGALALGL